MPESFSLITLSSENNALENRNTKIHTEHIQHIKQKAFIMNIKHPISVLTLTLTPFFIATGCSSTGDHNPTAIATTPKTQLSSSISETVIDETSVMHQALKQEIDTPDNNSLATIDGITIDTATINEVTPTTTDNGAQTETSTNNKMDSAAEELEMLGILESEIPPETTTSNDSRPAKHVFHFGFNKAELSDEEKTIIQDHGQFLASHPSQSIVVHGHADSQGDQNYNQFLSEKRAQHVAALLKKSGATKGQIEVLSWSSASPADALTSYKVNRRVELHYGQDYFAQKAQ